MSKIENVYDFGDLLRHAETIGYSWNEAHAHLDDFYPSNGKMGIEIDYYLPDEDGEILEPEYSSINDDARKILKSFGEKEDVSYITLIR